MSQFAWLGLPLLHAGKVRELYALEDPGLMLMVATDNVSAYDHVLDSPIPDKGVVLTQLSVWWFEQLDDLVANHVVSTEVPAEVAGRALVVERLDGHVAAGVDAYMMHVSGKQKTAEHSMFLRLSCCF